MSGIESDPVELREAGLDRLACAEKELLLGRVEQQVVRGHMPDLSRCSAAVGFAVPRGYLVHPPIIATASRRIGDLER